MTDQSLLALDLRQRPWMKQRNELVLQKTRGGNCMKFLMCACTGILIFLWLNGCTGSQTRVVMATASQAAAIREILGDQLPQWTAEQAAFFVGSQRPDGRLSLVVGCE